MNGPCPQMQERIADEVLGALDAQASEAVQRHLAQCPRCRAYAQALEQQGAALTALGDEVKTEMPARCERALEAFANSAGGPRRTMRSGRLVSLAAAAIVVLAVGIAIGRLTAPKPVDVEQLRADLQASITASLRPAVEQTVLTEVDRRAASAVRSGQTELMTEIVALIRADLRTFATDVVANSEEMMDRRFAEFVRLIEAARLKDRQRVVQAFEQVEQDRQRDRAQIGRGIKSLVTLTGTSPSPTNN